MQINTFNIFPASVSLASAQKILEGVRIRKTKYIPQSTIWISKLFIELANRDDRVCLTLDCSGINKDVLKDLEQTQINLIFKLVILILLMTNRLTTRLLTNK